MNETIVLHRISSIIAEKVCKRLNQELVQASKALDDNPLLKYDIVGVSFSKVIPAGKFSVVNGSEIKFEYRISGSGILNNTTWEKNYQQLIKNYTQEAMDDFQEKMDFFFNANTEKQ